jgi:hypothetical protein
MGHKRTTVSNQPIPSSGNVTITTDNVESGSSSGYADYVDTRLGNVSISSLDGVGSANDGQYLGYTSGSGNWEGKDLGLELGKGSYDWRYPSSTGYSVAAKLTTVNKLIYWPRKSGYGLTITDNPVEGSSMISGGFGGFFYNYGGGTVNYFPTGVRISKAGTYLLLGQFKARFNANTPLSVGFWNPMLALPLGPRVFYDPTISSDQGPCSLVGIIKTPSDDNSTHNKFGIQVRSGSCYIQDDPQAKHWQIAVIRLD